MNSQILVLLLIASFAQILSLSPAAATSGTSFSKADELAFLDKISKFAKFLSLMDHDLEIFSNSFKSAAGNKEQLLKLVASFKQSQEYLQSFEGSVVKEMDASRNYIERFSGFFDLNIFLIEAKSQARYLSQLEQIIHSFTNHQSTSLPAYQVSEKLGLLDAEIIGQFSSIIQLMMVDPDIFSDLYLTKHISSATKAKIDGNLGQVKQLATAMQTKVLKVFHEEVESLRVKGKQLNLLQKASFEKWIDSLSFTLSYLPQFELLYKKMHN